MNAQESGQILQNIVCVLQPAKSAIDGKETLLQSPMKLVSINSCSIFSTCFLLKFKRQRDDNLHTWFRNSLRMVFLLGWIFLEWVSFPSSVD